jgi:hypothetical protein
VLSLWVSAKEGLGVLPAILLPPWPLVAVSRSGLGKRPTFYRHDTRGSTKHLARRSIVVVPEHPRTYQEVQRLNLHHQSQRLMLGGNLVRGPLRGDQVRPRPCRERAAVVAVAMDPIACFSWGAMLTVRLL